MFPTRRLGRKNVWFSAGSRRGEAHKVFVVQAIALRAICMLRYVYSVINGKRKTYRIDFVLFFLRLYNPAAECVDR